MVVPYQSISLALSRSFLGDVSAKTTRNMYCDSVRDDGRDGMRPSGLANDASFTPTVVVSFIRQQCVATNDDLQPRADSQLARTHRRTTTLKFSERSSSGWTAPVMVTSGKLVTNYADVPSVIRMSDGTLAAHWTTVTDPRREGTDLLLSFSKDDGRTWFPRFSPHHDGTPTQHAFATLFELP
ncbi:MAG: hypothetical protein GEU82_11880, partial [Luteitalea sp.]|nr:hypothetical protein [Luteitalea sp.]